MWSVLFLYPPKIPEDLCVTYTSHIPLGNDFVKRVVRGVCICQVNSGRTVTGGHQEVGRCSTRGGSC